MPNSDDLFTGPGFTGELRRVHSVRGASSDLFENSLNVGKSQWFDDRFDPESRLNDMLFTFARSGRNWSDIEPTIRLAFPNVDAAPLQRHFNQLRDHQRMEEARARYQGGATREPLAYIAERIPFVGLGVDLGYAIRANRAQGRINRGEGTDEDRDFIAGEEALRRQGLGQTILDEVTRIPRLVGEAYVGGSILRGLAPAVAESPGLISRAAVASPRAFGGALVSNAARTAIEMPSLWVPQAVEQNTAAGREPYDLRGVGSAYAMGMLQTAVLGSLGEVGNNIGVGSSSVPSLAARLGARTVTGMAEQQVIDAFATGFDRLAKRTVGTSLGLDTGYGLLGELYRDRDQGIRHGIVQLVTFAAFSGLHEYRDGPPRARQGLRETEPLADVASALRERAEQGVPKADAIADVLRIYEERVVKPNRQSWEAAQQEQLARERDRIASEARGSQTDEQAAGSRPDARTGQESAIPEPMPSEMTMTLTERPSVRGDVEASRESVRVETELPPGIGPRTTLDRIRAKQRHVATPEQPSVAPRPPVTETAVSEPQGIRERLRRAVDDQSNDLTSAERHVLASRLDGKTLEQIGLDLGGVSRERMRQVEANAMAKLGEPGSFDKAVKRNEQMAGIEAATGHVAAPGEVNVAGKTELAGHRPGHKIQDQIERLTDAWLEASPSEKPAIQAELDQLVAQTQASGGLLFAPQTTGPLSSGKGGPGETQFDIIRSINEELKMPSITVREVPGATKQDIAYMEAQRVAVTGSDRLGESQWHMHEAGHHIALERRAPLEPSLLPKDVADGFAEFDYALNRPFGRVKMLEGFSEWLRLRQINKLQNLSREQEAAAKWGEAWLKQEGLEAPMDRIRQKFDQFQAQGPTYQAAGLLSPSNQLAPAQLESAWARWGNLFREYITNRDDAVTRLHAEATKRGHKLGPGEDAPTIISQLHGAEAHTANDFVKGGYWILDQDGRQVRVSKGWEHDIAGLLPEDLVSMQAQPQGWMNKLASFFIEPAKVTKADVAMVARHAVDMDNRGKPFVTPEQLEYYKAALAEWRQTDPGFLKRVFDVHDKLIESNNAGLMMLASPELHYLNANDAQSFIAAYPTYVSTARAREDAKVSNFEFARGQSGDPIVAPLITFRERYLENAQKVIKQRMDNAIAKYLLMEGMGSFGVSTGITSPGSSVAEPWPADGRGAKWRWRGPDGEITSFRITDKALYELVTGQQGNDSQVIKILRAINEYQIPGTDIKPLAFSKHIQTTGATAASMLFQAKNALIHDPITFIKQSMDPASVTSLPKMLWNAYAAEAQVAMGKVPKDVLFNMIKEMRGEEMKQFSWKPTAGIENLSNTWEFVKQIFKVAGAGELAPRMLEFRNELERLGWPLERIEAETVKANGAYDPVPYAVKLAAAKAAQEVTVPFGRGGILTDELNKFTPFFRPSVAALEKGIRNWRDNTKVAGLALAVYLGARVAHWMTFKDEDWYKNLSAYDRFTQFVVPIGNQLWRLPGPRGDEVPVGAATVSILEGAAGRDPRIMQALTTSADAALPPLPVPPIARVPAEVAMNRGWTGSPIVPKRLDDLPALDKALQFQLPYAMRQLTGGRGVVSSEPPYVTPEMLGAQLPVVRNAHQSVDDLYARLEDLRSRRLAFQQRRENFGRMFPDEVAYAQVEAAGRQVAEIAARIRGDRRAGFREPSEEEKARLRQQQIRIATSVLERVRR